MGFDEKAYEDNDLLQYLEADPEAADAFAEAESAENFEEVPEEYYDEEETEPAKKPLDFSFGPGMISLIIGALSIIISANGLETFGICGLIGLLAGIFGMKFSDRAKKADDGIFPKIGKILSAIGLGVGIGCLVLGIIIGIINKLAAAANA